MGKDYELTVYSYYAMECENDTWYNQYYSCSDENDGSIFKCLDSNFRTLNSFEVYFKKFRDECEDIPRSRWKKKETTGQEMNKQDVTKLVQTSLFMCERDEDNDLIYHQTEKGKVFNKMLKEGFRDEEKKLLTYLFIINAPFCYTQNYILFKSKQIWDLWATYELPTGNLKREMESFIKNETGNNKNIDIFNYDVVWYLSFYSDKDFITLYQKATSKELNELHEYTIDAYRNKDTRNVLAHKIQSTTLTKPALIETFIMLSLSECILGMTDHAPNFLSFYTRIVSEYEKLYPIRKNKVLDFIEDNEDIFKKIYIDITTSRDDDEYLYISENPNEIQYVGIEVEQRIDTTSVKGAQRFEQVSQILKRNAKERAHYRCELEPLNGCQGHYFTSREDNKNYLEVHHLVPHACASDFDNSIEIVENYVPLCPRCHRELHHGEDRARKKLITYLYNKRKEGLKEKGIDITLEQLLEYYGIPKDV